jgi:uncharacterized protein (TIGR02145 family)
LAFTFGGCSGDDGGDGGGTSGGGNLTCKLPSGSCIEVATVSDCEQVSGNVVSTCGGGSSSSAGGSSSSSSGGGGCDASIAVQIGSQCWMKKNLDVPHSSGNGNSWCYENQESNCNTYGRLYDWSAAKTVCPSGFRLPSLDDWDELVETAGGEDVAGKHLKTTSGWEEGGNGLNTHGFSALPGGSRMGGSFTYAGRYGFWWSSSDDGGGDGLLWYMRYDNDEARMDDSPITNGFSVRCIKDN